MIATTQKTLATLKKGDKFSIVSFTGMNIGQFDVTAVSKSQFKAINAKGVEMIFNKADGIQANAANAKYTNKAVDILPIPEPRRAKEAAPAPAPVVTPPAAKAAAPAAKGKGKTTTKEVPPAAVNAAAEEDNTEEWEEA